jgi:hypothetical protein
MKKLFLVTTAVALVLVLGTSTGAATDKTERYDCQLASTQPDTSPYELPFQNTGEMSRVAPTPTGCFPICTGDWCYTWPYSKPLVEWYCTDGRTYPDSCYDYCISPY